MSFAEGKLYGMRWDAYSVVIAATDVEQARKTFADWLAEKHGVYTNTTHTHAVPTRTIGNRYFLIAR